MTDRVVARDTPPRRNTRMTYRRDANACGPCSNRAASAVSNRRRVDGPVPSDWRRQELPRARCICDSCHRVQTLVPDCDDEPVTTTGTGTSNARTIDHHPHALGVSEPTTTFGAVVD